MTSFNINLDDKPNLSNLYKHDREHFREIAGTFVSLMEEAAKKKWYDLPQAIHTSLSFNDLVGSILNALLSTEEINKEKFSVFKLDLHPLALLSDKRIDLITGEHEPYDWKGHFALEEGKVTKDNLELIIRQMMYLLRWFDVGTVSKQLLANQFPVIDTKDIQKLPFQAALRYQQQELGELHVGKFFHDIGALNCGEVEESVIQCQACKIGELKEIEEYKVCPRCNAGFSIKKVIEF